VDRSLAKFRPIDPQWISLDWSETELRPANHAIDGTVVEHVNSACGVQNGIGKGT
jgi:hypothetical protein